MSRGRRVASGGRGGAGFDAVPRKCDDLGQRRAQRLLALLRRPPGWQASECPPARSMPLSAEHRTQHDQALEQDRAEASTHLQHLIRVLVQEIGTDRVHYARRALGCIPLVPIKGCPTQARDFFSLFLSSPALVRSLSRARALFLSRPPSLPLSISLSLFIALALSLFSVNSLFLSTQRERGCI